MANLLLTLFMINIYIYIYIWREREREEIICLEKNMISNIKVF